VKKPVISGRTEDSKEIQNKIERELENETVVWEPLAQYKIIMLKYTLL